MSVAIVPSRNCNVQDIIARSPVADVPQAEEILRRWLRRSEEVWLGMHDDEVACVYGLAPPTAISNRAYLWLLTTELVEKHKFLFVRHSQLVIEDALRRYDVIVGHVAVGNTPARRWLRWLGAAIDVPEKGFSKFEIRRRDG
jgi:hypothetical protein